MRSVPSFPSGTFTQVPWVEVSHRQSSSRSKQLTETHPGAPQDGEPEAGEDVAEPGDGGHEVAVGIGGEGPGQGPIETGHVGAEQERPWGPLGPAPDGEVLEEGPQVHHRALRRRERHRRGAGHAAAPGPAVVPGQEAFEVRPFELLEPTHRGVVSGEVLAEHDEAVGPQDHGGRAQRRAHDLEVAQRDRADLGLGDGTERLGQRGGPAHVLPRWAVADAQLVAGLVQAEGSGAVVRAGVPPGRGARVELGQESREVGAREPLEVGARPQAEQRQPGGQIPGPGGRPAEAGANLAEPGDIAAVALRPGGIELAGGLGEEQVEIGPQVALGEAPGEERPGAAAAQVGEASGRRSGHPHREIGVDPEQSCCRAASDAPGVGADRQPLDRLGVGDEQIGRTLTTQGDGGPRAHRVTSRARANSAATVSADRCT